MHHTRRREPAPDPAAPQNIRFVGDPLPSTFWEARRNRARARAKAREHRWRTGQAAPREDSVWESLRSPDAIEALRAKGDFTLRSMHRPLDTMLISEAIAKVRDPVMPFQIFRLDGSPDEWDEELPTSEHALHFLGEQVAAGWWLSPRVRIAARRVADRGTIESARTVEAVKVRAAEVALLAVLDDKNELRDQGLEVHLLSAGPLRELFAKITRQAEKIIEDWDQDPGEADENTPTPNAGTLSDEGAAAAEIEARLAAKPRARALWSAVRRLPPGQRQAVLLVDLRGLSHTAAARQLRLSAGALRARLHHAHRALQRDPMLRNAM